MRFTVVMMAGGFRDSTHQILHVWALDTDFDPNSQWSYVLPVIEQKISNDTFVGLDFSYRGGAIDYRFVTLAASGIINTAGPHGGNYLLVTYEMPFATRLELDQQDITMASFHSDHDHMHPQEGPRSFQEQDGHIGNQEILFNAYAMDNEQGVGNPQGYGGYVGSQETTLNRNGALVTEYGLDMGVSQPRNRVQSRRAARAPRAPENSGNIVSLGEQYVMNRRSNVGLGRAGIQGHGQSGPTVIGGNYFSTNDGYGLQSGHSRLVPMGGSNINPNNHQATAIDVGYGSPPQDGISRQARRAKGKKQAKDKIPHDSSHRGNPKKAVCGQEYGDRKACSSDDVHIPRISGIATAAGCRGAFSICLGDGYDNKDWGNELLFIGTGDDDQTWEGANQKLAETIMDTDIKSTGAKAKDWQNSLPVRVVRAANNSNDISPLNGYRYDGLYKLVEYNRVYRHDRWVYKYFLRRDDPVPGPWTREGMARVRALGLTTRFHDSWGDEKKQQYFNKMHANSKARENRRTQDLPNPTYVAPSTRNRKRERNDEGDNDINRKRMRDEDEDENEAN